jgi:lipoate-protein ligase A
METKEQIKARIINSNPSRISTVNYQEIELSDDEFNDAVEKRAEMEYEQQLKAKEVEEAKAAALAKLEALGLNEADLKALGL